MEGLNWDATKRFGERGDGHKEIENGMVAEE